MEQGLSFTVVEAGHPLDTPEASAGQVAFDIAHRVWLGAAQGTDWLHEAIEHDLGEEIVWYEVSSRRDSAHIGAAGEIAYVFLILFGAAAADFARNVYVGFAQRAGERSFDGLLEWVRRRTREHRSEAGLEDADAPPNFYDWKVQDLASAMTREVADVFESSPDRLELVHAERPEGSSLRAVYRDTETGDEFEVAAAADAGDISAEPHLVPYSVLRRSDT